MRRPWIRREPGPEDERRAAGLALAAGAALGVAVYYVARIVLARDPIDAPPSRGVTRTGERGEGEGS